MFGYLFSIPSISIMQFKEYEVGRATVNDATINMMRSRCKDEYKDGYDGVSLQSSSKNSNPFDSS